MFSNKKLLLPFILFFITKLAIAKELSLEMVWDSIAKQSKSQSAARQELNAATLRKTRASLHWLPQINLETKSYYTNDPGSNFLGLLSQRAVNTNDFQPNAINYPNTHLFNRGQLVVNLPLYEGGMRIAQLAKESHLAKSRNNQLNQIIIEQYSEITYLYGSLTLLLSQKSELITFKHQLAQLIDEYQLSSPSNPYGYSGFLSLKSLDMHVQMLISDNTSKIESILDTFSELGLSEKHWQPTKISLDNFLAKYFPASLSGDSENTKIHREITSAAQQQIAIEKAKYKPTVGVYAEGLIFNGDRNTATAFSTGLYLQWNLYDSNNYALTKEAAYQAYASKNHAAALSERERAESLSILSNIKGVKRNLVLIQNNKKLIDEQNALALKLFNKGAINATQLCDTLTKQLDIIKNETDIKLFDLMMHKELATKTHFKVPLNIERSDA